MFTNAWHMLGTPSMVVIIILSLASFALLYDLPTCTKTLPAFPLHLLL